MNETKVNTYTNHPKYQEPIVRSDLHNKIRYFFGIIIGYIVAIAIVLLGISSILFGIYEIVLAIFNSEIMQQDFLLKILNPVIGYILTLIGIQVFKWGRHLTRKTSREFV